MRTTAFAFIVFLFTLVCAIVGATLGMATGVCVACALFMALCIALHFLPRHKVMPASPEHKEDARHNSETQDMAASVDKMPALAPVEPLPLEDEGKATNDQADVEVNKKDDAAKEQSEQAALMVEANDDALGDEPKPTHESLPAATAEVKEPQDEPSFDYDDFCHSLFFSSDPIAVLQSIVTEAKDKNDVENSVPAAQRFIARLLEEAGVLDSNKKELGHVEVVRPRRSGLFYLRVDTTRIPYGAYLRLLQIEAALNALHFAHEYYSDLNNLHEQDFYRIWQRTCASICAQASDVDTADWSYLAMPWQVPFGPSDQGEWSVRLSIAEAIESVVVPYRLEARFRCNVSSGDVAIEFSATPARVFAHSAFVEGIGVVATTTQMREREASAYAARIGILLANHAFRTSSKIRRVWVAAIEETPSSHACLYSACIGRRAFSSLRMSSITSPLDTLRSLGATLQEQDGVLIPTASCFYLEDETFCPRFRHDLWSLSERALSAAAAQSLGAKRVSGLVVHEELPRTLAAEKILRGLPSSSIDSSAQQSVHAIMDAARNTSDFGVWCAAERAAAKLVDGKLNPDDTDSIRKEIISGDELTKAMDRAQRLMARQNPQEALVVINHAIGPLERNGTYCDTNAVAYRSFDSFTERVVYNRLNAHDARSIVLVPDAYLMSHLVASAILISLPREAGGDPQRAIAHARRALEIAPLNGTVNLGMAACLEAAGDTNGAAEQLTEYLRVAYHPQGIALAYFRLASLEWRRGAQKACLACYQQAIRLFPPLLPFAISEYQILCDNQESSSIELLDEKQIEEALGKEDIPMAPTPRTSYILYDGAAASVDAEVFPVAREMLNILEALSGDDVIRGIRASLEREPDE